MEDLNNPAKRAEIEYATQHFGFPPESFIDTLIGDATEIVKGNLSTMKKKITSDFNEKVPAEEIESSFKLIEEKYIENTEKIFYFKFGKYLRDNIFAIPSGLLLPEDKVHGEPGKESVDASKAAQVKEEFEKSCQKVKNAKLIRTALRNKVKSLKLVLEKQERILEQSRQLRKEGKELDELKEQSEKLEKKKDEVLEPLIKEVENNLSANRNEGGNEDSGIDESGSFNRKRSLDGGSQSEESTENRENRDVEVKKQKVA